LVLAIGLAQNSYQLALLDRDPPYWSDDAGSDGRLRSHGYDGAEGRK
jgi:hypothetical protein